MFRLILFFLVFFLGFTLPQTSFALGISPASIEVFDLLPDNVITRTLTISRGEDSKQENLIVNVQGSGTEAIFFPKGNELTFEEGEKIIVRNFEIRPADFSQGSYEAEMHVVYSDNNDEAGIPVNFGVESAVKFTVTDEEKVNFKVENVQIGKQYTSDPLSLSYVFDNQGNTEAGVSKIEIRALDASGKVITNKTIKDDIAMTAPFSREKQEIETKFSLEEGNYRLEVSFLDSQDGEVYKNEQNIVVSSKNNALQSVDGATPIKEEANCELQNEKSNQKDNWQIIVFSLLVVLLLSSVAGFLLVNKKK